MKKVLEMAASCIQTMLQVPAMVFPTNSKDLLSNVRQSLFTSSQFIENEARFSEFLRDLSDYAICSLLDHLNVSFYFLRIKKWIMLVGPFLTHSIMTYEAQACLDSIQLNKNLLDDLMFYYKSIVQLNKSQIEDAFYSIIRFVAPDNVIPTTTDFKLQSGNLGSLSDEYEPYSKRYVDVNHNIQIQYMEKIMQGDFVEAKRLFNILWARYDRTEHEAATSGPVIGAIFRTMTRIAAMSVGLPSDTLHSITEANRRAIQNTSDIRQIKNSMIHLAEEVCQQVRRHRLIKYSPRIKHAVLYIISNLDQPLTVHSIAKAVQISPNYLSAKFHDEVKMTVTEFIRAQRLGNAAHLLKFTKMSISEISTHVGIHDSNYFAKIFRKEYGKSPSDYRKG